MTYVAQYLTVAALFAGYAMVRHNLLNIALLDPYSLRSLLNYGLFAFCAIFGLWFLVPGIFDRSLARMRHGTARLICDLGLVLVGLVTLLVWVLLVKQSHSPLRPYLSDRTILMAAVAWLPLYVHAFLFPAAAFARHDEVADHAPRTFGYDTPITRTLGVPNTESWQREKPGIAARLMGVPAFLALVLGIFGWTHPLWLPSVELQALLAARQAELLSGLAALGALAGWTAAGRRGGGRARRLMQKALGAAALGAIMAALANPITSVGLPYAASFAMPTAHSSAEVTVVEKGQAHRKRACDYTATVTLTGNLGAPVTICNVPADLWDVLQPGDRLTLSGPGTRFGMRYETATPAL